jgi:hypothetical protein
MARSSKTSAWVRRRKAQQYRERVRSRKVGLVARPAPVTVTAAPSEESNHVGDHTNTDRSTDTTPLHP